MTSPKFFIHFYILVTIIETAERKVTVISAKPSSVPSTSYLAAMKPQTPLVNKSNGNSYSDAFAKFVHRGPKAAEPEPIVRQAVPTKVIVEPLRVVVQPVLQKPPPIPHAIQVHSVPAKVTVVQKKQETWTTNILKQTQTQAQKKLAQNQNVTTERIQPYVSGHLYSAPVRAAEGQQIMYKIVNAPSIQNSPAHSQLQRMTGQQQFH